MSDPRNRSAAAAERVLAAHADGAPLSSIRIDLAAWAIGATGGQPPVLADPAEQLHVRLAAMIGAGQLDDVPPFLERHLPEDAGQRLLFSACVLAGEALADSLVELAHRFRDRHFDGSMIARTSRPDRLLALFENPRVAHAVLTTGELVIVGRDAGAPIAEAEARWASLVDPFLLLAYLPEFCDALARIRARESLDAAATLVDDLGFDRGRGHVRDGAHAVLARLVREDPARAVALVANGRDASARLAWLEGILWWFELPPAAEELVADLLSAAGAELVLPRVRALVRAHRTDLLDAAIASAASVDPLVLAGELAPNLHGMRAAGYTADAERMRERMAQWLPATPTATGRIAPLDLLDALSAPGRPTLAPWKDCP